MKKLLLLSLLCPFILISQVQIGQDIYGEQFSSLGMVSLSSDGTILATGAPFATNDNNEDYAGRVRVYENQLGIWTQVGQDIEGDNFGFQVRLGQNISLSSNGSIIAISDGQDPVVRVHENQSGIWTQLGATIDPNDGSFPFNSRASSLSLSSDGTVLAIGCSQGGETPLQTGFVSIFKYQSGNWTQIGSILSGDAPGDWFGRSISLSSDGTVVAIGASMINNSGSGYARIYENQSGTWNQIGTDINGEATEDGFGRSISLSSDGSVVAIGGQTNDSNGIDSGHVQIYNNQSDNWIQIGQDIIGEAAGDLFGTSVSLSSDGNILAVGAIFNDANGPDSGHVRIYQNVSGSWSQIGTDIDGEGTGDWSGFTVSLSSNGTVVAMGAVNNDGNGQFSGQARVFDLSALLSSDEFVLSQFSLYPNPAKTKVTIDLKAGLELEAISVYNNLGQQIMTSKNLVIDTSSLNAGLYYLQIKTDKGNGTKKLIIE